MVLGRQNWLLFHVGYPIFHLGTDLLSSALQKKILQIVCTRKDVTYKILIQETKRDRITVLQSVESLIKHNLIEKQKTNPEYEKSKLIFKATPGGKQIACAYFGISLEDIMKLEDDEQIANYLEFIKDITDPIERKELLQPLSDLLTSPRARVVESKREDDEKTHSIRREVLRDGFKEVLLELFKNENYDAKKFLNNKSIRWFKKLFTSEETQEIKEYLRQVVENANLTIERLPE